ncbi:MAG: 2-phospho-L-lactate guanylyltransferase [Pseudomonadales bacterium]|nr:2-phospho-L-lactate guanylyltransferase [Halioglobus sp.]MCP5129525.1 2-phospho-L-lactate guanylyltransferase [Pseudomonadales bacterium]
MTQALVPLKDLVQAKTRLAGLLSPSERRALAQVMLEDVLTVLASHPDISGVTLVSSDPSAHMLATQYGARHWPETEMACRGLNAVAARASERLLADGGEPLLLVHADLPMLTAADVSAVLAARESAGLVVGCDRHGKGTNLLCFDAGSMPPFCFGADSCARHVAAARSHGIAVTVLERAGIGLDVDEPADLESLLSQLAGKDDSHTATLMHSTGLGARIGLALASLSPRATPRDRQEVL